MKKLFFILTLTLAGVVLASAQTPTAIFNEFSEEKDVTAINVSGSFGNYIKDDDGVMKNVESVTVLAFKDCKQSVKDRFISKVGSMELTGYERLVKVNKNSQVLEVFIKGSEDTVKELILVAIGDKAALITVKGEFSKSGLLSKSNKLTADI